MKLIVHGIEAIDEQLKKLGGREHARKIVEAGSAAAVKKLQERTEQAHHIMLNGGEMMKSFAPGKYHEDIDECWQDVYPQGYDSRGVSNAVKGFVINYGYGGRRTAKTGDKFITGRKPELDEVVGAAMRAEAERLMNE